MLCTVFAATVSATDLVNKDGKGYDVKIQSVGTLNTSIGANTTRPVTDCMSGCTVEVVGVGKVKITGKEKAVTIKDGKLSVQ